MNGKVAIVTGAAGGIGSATVAALLARGASVVLADLDVPGVRDLAAGMDAGGARTLACGLDLRDEASVVAMVAAAVTRFGGLDILVNNAAHLTDGLRDTDIEHMELAVWDAAFAVNVRGTMLCCRHSLPHLGRSAGCIVNVASSLALQGHLVQQAYSASKAAIVQMTRSIAASHGRRSVRCNAVLPGITLSPSAEAALPARLRAMQLDETLLPRLGQPDDVAQVIAFLASDAARHVTAQALAVDGGNTSHVPGFAGMRLFLQETAAG